MRVVILNCTIFCDFSPRHVMRVSQLLGERLRRLIFGGISCPSRFSRPEYDFRITAQVYSEKEPPTKEENNNHNK